MRASHAKFTADIKAAIVSRRRVSIIADYAVHDAVNNYR